VVAQHERDDGVRRQEPRVARDLRMTEVRAHEFPVPDAEQAEQTADIERIRRLLGKERIVLSHPDERLKHVWATSDSMVDQSSTWVSLLLTGSRN